MAAENHPPCQSTLASPVVPSIGSCEHVGGLSQSFYQSHLVLLCCHAVNPRRCILTTSPERFDQKSHNDQMMQRGEHPLWVLLRLHTQLMKLC